MAQLLQLAAPAEDAYIPCGHSAQSEDVSDPVMLKYFPGKQLKQDDCPARD
jgi:hypothetical protein